MDSLLGESSCPVGNPAIYDVWIPIVDEEQFSISSEHPKVLTDEQIETSDEVSIVL